MGFTAKMKDVFKEYNYLIVCFFCFVISLLGIWIGKWAFVVYACVIVGCSFFYDVNKMLVLCSFGLFFESCFNFWQPILFIVLSLAIVCGKEVVLKKKKLSKDLIFPVIVIVILVVMFFTINFNVENIKNVFGLIIPLCVAIEIFFLRDKIRLKTIVKGITLILILSSLSGIILFYTKVSPVAFHIDDRGVYRLKGLTGHENKLAIWVSIIWAMFFVYYFNKKLSVQQLALISIPLFLFGVMTKSKMFLILFIVISITYLIYSYIQNWKSGLIHTLIICFVFGIIFLIMPNKVSEYIGRFTDYFQDTGFINMITTGRVGIWEYSLKLWSKNVFTILFGIGQTASLGKYVHTHNAYIEWLTYCGLFGFLLVVVLIVYFVFMLSKKQKRGVFNYFVIFLIFLISIIDPISHENALLIMFAVIQIIDVQTQKERRKVLYFNSTLNFGGTEVYMLNVIKNLKDTFDFVIVTRKTDKPDSRILKMIDEIGCEVKYVYGRRKIAFSLEMLRFLSSCDGMYDIMHINALNKSTGLLCFMAKNFSNINKIIYHSHMGGEDNTTNQKIAKLGDVFAKKYATNLVACSNVAANFMFDEEYVKNHNIEILNNSIDLPKFSYNEKIRLEYRKKMGLENKFVLLHVGRFAKQKNHEKLIDVFRKVCEKDSNCELLLVGEGNLKKDILDKVKKFNLSDKVKFLDAREDVNCLLQAADVFVMTSIHEGLPISAVEAQASGLPLVLSSNISTETNITGNCEFVGLNKSADDWANAILRLKKFERKNINAKIVGAKFDNVSAMEDIKRIYLS